MRMSPRLKARRGRFGASGLKGPSLLILGPGGRISFGPGSPAAIANFTGTSSDDLDGDLSSQIEWFVHGFGSPSPVVLGSPILGTTASIDLSGALATGSPAFDDSTFRVVGSVSDSGGATAVRTLTITVVDAADYIPNLQIVSPGSPGGASTFGPGSPLVIPNFVATAIDKEDGDISADVEWFVQGPGSPSASLFGSPSSAIGSSVDLDSFLVSNIGSPQGGGSPNEVSTFKVEARIIDSGGNVRRKSITVTVDTNPS